MTRRPRILLFFYRFMEFRLFFQTGMALKLADHADVVVVVPESAVASTRVMVGDRITVVGSSHSKKTVLDDFRGNSIGDIIGRLLAFVYAWRPGGPNNITPQLHFRALRQQARRRGLLSVLATEAMIGMARLASALRPVRRALQWVYAQAAYEPSLSGIFAEYDPDVIVVGSFGVSTDGLAMLEAQRRGVPTVVVLQTWDRTSSKGYPTVAPDYVLTWSDVTADEAHYFLDVPRNRVFVDGAPLWDSFFNNPCPMTRENFCAAFGMDPQSRIVYFAMNSLGYHGGNMTLMRSLAEMVRDSDFGTPAQLLIRLHPSYFSAGREKADMDALAAELSGYEKVFIDRPKTVEEADGLLFSAEDQAIQAASFYHCDMTVSVVSTYMIESAIFDKPAINVECGRWVSSLYDMDVSEYVVQHLKRIYDYNAVYRVRSMSELRQTVSAVLRNPNERTFQRRRLIDVEIPVNRGTAHAAFCRRLTQLAAAHQRTGTRPADSSTAAPPEAA